VWVISPVQCSALVAGAMADSKNAKKMKGGGFQSLALSAEVLKGVMQMGYRVPTPVQRKSLPVTLTNVDTVVMARTGSGKTAAFLIPVLEKLKEHSAKVGARAIVLSPSRELALQTLTFARKMGRFTGLRFALLVGGDSMEKQFEALADNPDVVIATPGRLMHHLQVYTLLLSFDLKR
jgi:ATP-dependent RNA helicase DDX54/DBP10